MAELIQFLPVVLCLLYMSTLALIELFIQLANLGIESVGFNSGRIADQQQGGVWVKGFLVFADRIEAQFLQPESAFSRCAAPAVKRLHRAINDDPGK